MRKEQNGAWERSWKRYGYEARHTILLFLFVTFFGLDCALSSKIQVILNFLTKRNVELGLSSQNWWKRDKGLFL